MESDISVRFWAKVAVRADNQCWQWKGIKRKRNGIVSGAMAVNPRVKSVRKLAHRIAFELTHGPVSPAEVITQTCGNRLCCNPNHLSAGPRARTRAASPPHPMQREKPTQADRFWRRVSSERAGCWKWLGPVTPKGYGWLPSTSTQAGVSAHRLSYELHAGPIGAGLVVMHSCDNRRCVNPAHLSVGTHKDNVQDMIQKGRDPYRARRVKRDT